MNFLSILFPLFFIGDYGAWFGQTNNAKIMGLLLFALLKRKEETFTFTVVPILNFVCIMVFVWGVLMNKLDYKKTYSILLLL